MLCAVLGRTLKGLDGSFLDKEHRLQYRKVAEARARRAVSCPHQRVRDEVVAQFEEVGDVMVLLGMWESVHKPSVCVTRARTLLGQRPHLKTPMVKDILTAWEIEMAVVGTEKAVRISGEQVRKIIGERRDSRKNRGSAMGISVPTRGLENGANQSGARRSSQDDVECYEVGPKGSSESGEVCVFPDAGAAEVGDISRNVPGSEEDQWTADGAFFPPRSSDEISRHGVLTCGYRAVNTTHANGGPEPSGTEVRGCFSESTGGQAADADESRTVELPVSRKGPKMPTLSFTKEDILILTGEEEAVWVPIAEPYYGPASGAICIREDGHIRKVRPARTACTAPLCPITPNRIDLEACMGLPIPPTEKEREVLGMLQGRAIRRKLLKNLPMERKVSRKFSHEDIKCMREWGVIEQRRNVDMVHPAFKVPKGKGSRLIVDCGELNQRLPKPGDMGLPKLHEVLDGLLENEIVAQ
eukprot:PhM_4_TR18036/c2_g1_i5/m.37307